jgi:hypothetical protein
VDWKEWHWQAHLDTVAPLCSHNVYCYNTSGPGFPCTLQPATSSGLTMLPVAMKCLSLSIDTVFQPQAALTSVHQSSMFTIHHHQHLQLLQPQSLLERNRPTGSMLASLLMLPVVDRSSPHSRPLHRLARLPMPQYLSSSPKGHRTCTVHCPTFPPLPCPTLPTTHNYQLLKKVHMLQHIKTHINGPHVPELNLS